MTNKIDQRKKLEWLFDKVWSKKEQQRLLVHFSLWSIIGEQALKIIIVLSVIGLIGGFFSKWIALAVLGYIFYLSFQTYNNKQKDDKNYPQAVKFKKGINEDRDEDAEKWNEQLYEVESKEQIDKFEKWHQTAIEETATAEKGLEAFYEDTGRNKGFFEKNEKKLFSLFGSETLVKYYSLKNAQVRGNSHLAFLNDYFGLLDSINAKLTKGLTVQKAKKEFSGKFEGIHEEFLKSEVELTKGEVIGEMIIEAKKEAERTGKKFEEMKLDGDEIVRRLEKRLGIKDKNRARKK